MQIGGSFAYISGYVWCQLALLLLSRLGATTCVVVMGCLWHLAEELVPSIGILGIATFDGVRFRDREMVALRVDDG